jgi:hypothetical protein
MKKFAFASTAVLLGFSTLSLADEPTPATDMPAPTCCTADGSCKPCKSPCSKDGEKIKCGETAWLDIETVTIEAANGDPLAQYTVAYLTETGDDNTPPDAEKAKEWYAKSIPGLEKAAAEGHAGACCALAHMYAEGKGVEKNPELAAKYKKMYKELCHKKCKDMKPCCPKEAAPQQPAQN